MHIADRVATELNVRGDLNWGGKITFSFSGNYKNGSYDPTHAQPGVRVSAGVIFLEPTGRGKTITIGLVPNRSLLKHAALSEPHRIPTTDIDALAASPVLIVQKPNETGSK